MELHDDGLTGEFLADCCIERKLAAARCHARGASYGRSTRIGRLCERAPTDGIAYHASGCSASNAVMRLFLMTSCVSCLDNFELGNESS